MEALYSEGEGDEEVDDNTADLETGGKDVPLGSLNVITIDY